MIFYVLLAAGFTVLQAGQTLRLAGSWPTFVYNKISNIYYGVGRQGINPVFIVSKLY